MSELRLPQGTIHVRDTGDPAGPVIVFVHGLLVDGTLWRKVVPRLEDRFRCIWPDWPLGSHRTPMDPAADLSPRGVAHLIADALEALDLRDVTLVGNDTGGAICQLLVTERPERVGRLVLTNCDAFDKFPPFPFNLVFALLRGPMSIKVLFEQMRLKALRHSPLGFGLLVNPDAQLTASWLEPGRTDVTSPGCCGRSPRPT
jgi:pimeloyl-ACP methyl ester carboxylesterase